jgi:AraC-like DNA-binding protein
MHGGRRFVHKARMKPALSVHRSWRSLAVASAPQILACAHCVLLEWEYDELSAPFWRWYWNDRPGAWLILKRERVPIEPGRVVLIPPHTSFGTGCKGPVGHFYVHFALGLDRVATPGRVFQHTPTASERGHIRRLVSLGESTGEVSPLATCFLLQAVLNASLAAVPDEYWEGRLTDVKIARALEALSRDPGDCDNVTLAREAGMNTNAFIRKFLQATGHTPHRYRLRLRIERAAAWLREGKMSIDEIAAATGFCDRFHFSRVFKQVLGTSPARYRRAEGRGG